MTSRCGSDVQVIFAFYLALFQGMARMKSGLHKKLKFGSIVGLRLGWQVLAYFFVVSGVWPVTSSHPSLHALSLNPSANGGPAQGCISFKIRQ